MFCVPETSIYDYRIINYIWAEVLQFSLNAYLSQCMGAEGARDLCLLICSVVKMHVIYTSKLTFLSSILYSSGVYFFKPCILVNIMYSDFTFKK